ncbi:PREDICTED: armadillo repeat-containing protein 7-like isoform X1 [Priapulus caudatus]|uniref:Armadillo repeat-containing protein 7-like isoform X1 n=1 Tax=Priapulus caudatus TaxID=37621 RepID=A0ABM1F3P5_PRICU|nr:PREDICTED: armadillo repeat-containing protein 7-like isoform X1 [Priapulus caudatus]
MFSTKEYLDKKTGPYGVGRLSYLQMLVTEFQDTDSQDAKLQVLSNLANFAYDPINYDHMRSLNVMDLFLDSLSDSDSNIVESATAGICNLCLGNGWYPHINTKDEHKKNKVYILQQEGVRLLLPCLSSMHEETVLNTMACLMFLVTPESKQEITELAVVDCMLRLQRSTNPRLSNMAAVFLADYCTAEQVAEAQRVSSLQEADSVVTSNGT